MDTLSLQILGRDIQIHCRDSATLALLLANYGHLRQSLAGTAALEYTVGHQERSNRFFIKRAGQDSLLASDAGEFLLLFEKDMTVELQKLRSDLYFVHAAVLKLGPIAFMLVGESGSGKSMTTWALLLHGCSYWSDELGPIDLQTLEVYPYPHALCLKDAPPRLYQTPKDTLFTSRTRHIPTAILPCEVGCVPAPLSAIFFLRYQSDTSEPIVLRLSKAGAAARLLANALNPLAHEGNGLDGAIAISRKVTTFELISADLTATCGLVNATLQNLLNKSWSHTSSFSFKQHPKMFTT